MARPSSHIAATVENNQKGEKKKLENFYIKMVGKRTTKKSIRCKKLLILPTGSYILPATFVVSFLKELRKRRASVVRRKIELGEENERTNFYRVGNSKSATPA